MKHLLLSATLLLSTSSLFAQLHVQPNPTGTGTDSYVYANDVVLYVHQDVSLIENNEVETEASIYLRGDAQLIQGTTGTSTNTGSGKLSVWQYGRTNNFGYHNWSTPVGNPQFGAGPSIAGNKNFGIRSFYDVQEDSFGDLHPTYSVQQVSTGGVNGERVPNLRISTRWIYVLRGLGTYADWVHVGNNDGIFPGDGYTMKGTIGTDETDPQLYDFRGRPNDGNISKGTVPTNVFVYLGNPYPSNIDMRDFVDANPGIEPTVWYYEKSPLANSHNLTAIQSGYGTWVPGGGDSIAAQYGGGTAGTWTRPTYVMYDGSGNPLPGSYGMGADLEARFAPIGQGFMVRGSATPSEVFFTNAMRRYIPAGYYNDFKNTAINANSFQDAVIIPDPDPDPVIDFYSVDATLRFHVEVNESYTRDMVLMFSNNTTKGEDRGFDGRHPSVIAAGDAFWKLENHTAPFVIQTRPYDQMDVIPLGIKTKNGVNSFKVKVVEAHNFTRNMYLFDLQNNQYQRLGLNDDAIINYSGGAGTITDRFFIVFRRGIQDVDIPTKIAEMNIDFFQNNRLSQLEVYNPEVIDIKTAWVFDMSGKKVIEEKNLGKQRSYTFSTANLSSGVYMVVLTTVDDLVIDYKVTVHNKN